MFQLNEEPLTGQSGPVNLASKMAPDGKTPKRGQKKVKKSSELQRERRVHGGTQAINTERIVVSTEAT